MLSGGLGFLIGDAQVLVGIQQKSGVIAQVETKHWPFIFTYLPNKLHTNSTQIQQQH